MTRLHGRYPYSPIRLRGRPYDWPQAASGSPSMSGSISNGLPSARASARNLAPAGHSPDVLNYAWRDYGNRVGVFRLADLFGELDLPVSLLVNAAMIEQAPQALAAFPGAELVGHGRSNSERQGTLSEKDERQLIAETAAALETYSGTRPRGWLGPWISQSHADARPAAGGRLYAICSTGAMTTSRCG